MVREIDLDTRDRHHEDDRPYIARLIWGDASFTLRIGEFETEYNLSLFCVVLPRSMQKFMLALDRFSMSIRHYSYQVLK